jgi:FkbM family methyltransferase
MLIKEYGKAKARLIRVVGLEPRHETDSAKNGEYRLLKLVGSFPEIRDYDAVIDVGANSGEWTATAMGMLAHRGIKKFYCVEPIPTFAEKIRSRFAPRKDVDVIELALSSSAQEKIKIFEAGGGGRIYPDYRGSKTLAAPLGPKKIVAHQVAVVTGDSVFSKLAINPYLVKIDCDGHDLHVLKGFEHILRERRPLVQFEYSDFWIAAGSRLRDACLFLEAAGYNVYKMFPDRLARFKFNSLFETFGYQNIVAAPREFSGFEGAKIPLPAA